MPKGFEMPNRIDRHRSTSDECNQNHAEAIDSLPASYANSSAAEAPPIIRSAGSDCSPATPPCCSPFPSCGKVPAIASAPLLAFRRGVPADAEALHHIFITAIMHVDDAAYSMPQRMAWAACRDVTGFRKDLAQPSFHCLVATHDAIPVGFGALMKDRIEYLYALPNAPRSTGAQILTLLEQEARHRGIARLHLTSSRNAEGFYRLAGYAGTERETTCRNCQCFDVALLSKSLT